MEYASSGQLGDDANNDARARLSPGYKRAPQPRDELSWIELDSDKPDLSIRPRLPVYPPTPESRTKKDTDKPSTSKIGLQLKTVAIVISIEQYVVCICNPSRSRPAINDPSCNLGKRSFKHRSLVEIAWHVQAQVSVENRPRKSRY